MAWTSDLPNADTGQIRTFCHLVAQPGAIIEMRALGAPRCGTVSGYFDGEHSDAFIAACVEYSGQAEGVYATINPVHPDLLARAANRVRPWAKHTTSDADILRRRWLPLDFDPVRPAGISATDAEHAAAVALALEVDAWLRSLGFPDDAIVVADSGNGAHLPVCIDLPNDDDAKQLVARCIAAVAHRFSNDVVTVDTTTSNAARIWKVYGTVAAKGDATDQRPHTMARIHMVSDHVVPVSRELLVKLARFAPPAAVTQPPGVARRSGNHGVDALDVAQWLAEHNVPVVDRKPWQGGVLFVINPCPWNPVHTNRSAFVIQHATGAISAGCHHDGCQGKGWKELRDLYEPGWRNGRPRTPPIPGGVSTAIQREFSSVIARKTARGRKRS